MKLFCGAAILLSLFSLSANATFLPPGEWANRAEKGGPSNISEAEFNSVVSAVQGAYAPIAKKFGGTLSISGDWKSDKLNAGATQMGASWRVVISGAIARRPELNLDGFTLILCHEVGHHLGGFSFAAAGNPFEKAWAANEGQADYFSTHVCAQKLWKDDKEKNASFRAQVSDYVRERCDTAWGESSERDLCYRVSAAVNAMTDTMAAIMNKPAPHFETPDPAVVPKTSDAHPAVQCRMDTTFSGALCAQSFGEDMIPGKTAPGGLWGTEAEKESALRTCTRVSNHVMGLRPSCWFKARM